MGRDRFIESGAHRRTSRPLGTLLGFPEDRPGFCVGSHPLPTFPQPPSAHVLPAAAARAWGRACPGGRCRECGDRAPSPLQHKSHGHVSASVLGNSPGRLQRALTPHPTPSPRSTLNFKAGTLRRPSAPCEPESGGDRRFCLSSSSQKARTPPHSLASLRADRSTVCCPQTQTLGSETVKCKSSACALWAP